MTGRALVLVLLALLAVPVAAGAQAGSCQLVSSQNLERRTEGIFQTIYVTAPVVQCSGGARVSADQGTLYQASNEIHLFGSVDFRDPDRRLTSNQAVYSSTTGRLFATGDVVFTDQAEGMTLRGPELEYYRAMEGRPQSQAIATQRPHLTLQPRERPGESRPADGEPIEIDADRMTMVGNEQYTAVGRVEMWRSDFQAFSREARVDQLAERMELRGSARIQGEQFDLTGDAIDVMLPGDRIEQLHARRDAELVGDDLRIDAEEIRLFFEDDMLQRMLALQVETTQRPVATARAFRLEADSIEAISPNQLLERVIAVGSARGEALDTTLAPSGRIERSAPHGDLASGERDWILGDTVIGYFVAVEPTSVTEDTVVADAVVAAVLPAEAGDTQERREVQIDRLVAIGSARSLYRVERSENGRPAERPGLNYLVGDLIALSFDNGELQVADVRGLQRGLFLDPDDAPEAPAPADSAEPDPAPAEADPPANNTPLAQR